MKEIGLEEKSQIKERILYGGENLQKILTDEYGDYEFALIIKAASCLCAGPGPSPPNIMREDAHDAYLAKEEAEKNCPKTPASYLEYGYYRIAVCDFGSLLKKESVLDAIPFSGLLLNDGDIALIFEKLRKNLIGYIENPKTKGSGIVCCIPQAGRCPMNCPDCFFQSGRSYLEPLDKNLPNMPDPEMVEKYGYIVRVNDGNDSNNQRKLVIERTKIYKRRLYNTSDMEDLEGFEAPIILTVNPADMTDVDAYLLNYIPKNLMFVRIRVNTWNLDLVDRAVEHYSARQVPIVLTFMAYYETPIPKGHEKNYAFRKRTLNNYWAITRSAWEKIMAHYERNFLVYSCGQEGEKEKGGATGCRHCGNCLREYFATMERMKNIQ